jgi:chromosome partitioning protein
MKVIVIATNKGGEGKTFKSLVLAEFIAMILNKRTLAIDLDPQANFSGRLIQMSPDKIPPIHPDYDPPNDKDWDGISSIADIFYGQFVVPYPTKIPNLELAPAHKPKLTEAQAVTKFEVVEKVHLRLKQFLEVNNVRNNYDVIVIDTPPAIGPLTFAAIKAATHIIIPAQMEQFSIEGIYGMMQLWKQESYIRSNDNPLNLIGILPNKYRDTNLHMQLKKELHNMPVIGKYVIPHEIKLRAIYAEILAEGANPKSIFELPTKNVARQEIEMTCRYITERVFSDV